MKEMNALKLYDIKFVGLKNGKHQYTFNLDHHFFNHFDFDEFKEADIDIVLDLIKHDNLLEFSIHSQGIVNVPCDISGEYFNQEIHGALDFIIKFGEEFNDEREDLIILPYNAHTYNVAQQIYENIILNLPAKRIHPDVLSGKIKDSGFKYIINYDTDDQEIISETEEKEIDPRWAALKKILTDKK